MVVILVIAVAIAVSLVATPVAAGVARRSGLLDQPGPLKVQQRPVPYLGGLALFTGAAVGLVAGQPALALPGALALLLGTTDDAVGLAAGWRLVGEAGIGVVAGAIIVPRAGVLGWLAVALLVVVTINAFNMIDGLDGLAAGVALMAALGFTLLLPAHSRPLAAGLAGALVGFLWYNRPPARIYLGDGGSYLIGTWLAILAVAAWHSPGHGRPWTPAVLFVAVPILELLVAVVRRLRAGRHPFGGDRDHIYDQLVAKGRTPAGTVVAVVAAQAILVAGGLAVARLAGALPAAAVTATVIVCLLALLARAGFFAPPPLRRTP